MILFEGGSDELGLLSNFLGSWRTVTFNHHGNTKITRFKLWSTSKWHVLPDGRTDVGKTRKISQEEGISWRTRSNRTHSQQTKNLSEEAEITFNLLIKIAINLIWWNCVLTVNYILFEIRTNWWDLPECKQSFTDFFVICDFVILIFFQFLCKTQLISN